MCSFAHLESKFKYISLDGFDIWVPLCCVKCKKIHEEISPPRVQSKQLQRKAK